MYVLLFPRKLFFLKLQIVENSNFNFVTKKLNFCRGTYSREELGNFEASQPNLQYSDPILFFFIVKNILLKSVQNFAYNRQSMLYTCYRMNK